MRYGLFYGPGTTIAADGSMARMAARRRLPVVGGGAGMGSFCHIDDAAGAALAALERGASNARARAELGWQPQHPDWREGFRLL